MASSHDRIECPYCKVDVLQERSSAWRRRSILIIICSGMLLATGLIVDLLNLSPIGSLLLLGGSAAVPGVFIIRNGISALLRKELDVNVLMTAAAIGAFSIGYEAEGAIVFLLFYTAEFLEDYAGDRTRRSVSELMNLAPQTATLKTEDGEEEAHPHKVEGGETIIVRPGERIPLDGRVMKGSTSVDQSPVTGESVPVSKGEGDEVFAGTLNEEGYIEVEVTKPPNRTTLSKIVELVESAQREQSRTQRLVNRIANYYTPAILMLALLITTIPVLIFSEPLTRWVYRSLVLLTVSCPCAFVLSTPITMTSGITSGARNGLLVKGGSYIEEIQEEKVLAIDKTRTLTEGTPEVTDVTGEKLLQIAVALESKTGHPIGEAIVKYGKDGGIEPPEVQEFESIPGEGVMGKTDEGEFFVGGREFFEERGIKYPERKVEELELQGKTVTLVGDGTRTLGAIATEDRIRENAAEVIARLKEGGMKIVMLTGDNERVAGATAGELGIEEFHANLLPEDKAEKIKEMKAEYGHVSMVGDGVNDAPALAEACVGIALGAAGSDVAIETADIVLMEDDLRKLPYLWDLGDRTMKAVKENISISIAVKGVLAVLAVLGFVTLSIAVGVGDMGISFVVILNALRIGIG